MSGQRSTKGKKKEGLRSKPLTKKNRAKFLNIFLIFFKF
jgi:hypothetical protein